MKHKGNGRYPLDNSTE